MSFLASKLVVFPLLVLLACGTLAWVYLFDRSDQICIFFTRYELIFLVDTFLFSFHGFPHSQVETFASKRRRFADGS